MAAQALGLAAAGVVAWYVAHIPVQVSDCVGNLLELQQLTYRQLFGSTLFAPGYIRPMAWIQFKLAFEASMGHYWAAFKLVHTAQLVATALLFVHLLRVRSAGALALVPVALAVLFGLHTFNGTVREAFPVNAYLTMIMAILGAISLVRAEHRWLNDVAAVVLFVFSILTVESGILVLVAILAGRMAGKKGVSAWGILAMFLVLDGYLYLRFGPFGVGLPGLTERSSGFGLRVLEPRELLERFGAQPLYFYAYNVVSSVSTVLFSEPRAGVWVLVERFSTGETLPAWLLVNLLASTLATIVVAWFGVRAGGRWWRGRASEDDRLAWVALGVLLANAVLCYAYTKSVMMSAGGVCWALLVYVALRDLASAAQGYPWAARVPALVGVAVLSAVWGVRFAGLPVLLREEAFSVRNDWAMVYPWLTSQRIDISRPAARGLVETLRRDALSTPVPNPKLVEQAHLAWFDLD